jgi:hypothetical protein
MPNKKQEFEMNEQVKLTKIAIQFGDRAHGQRSDSWKVPLKQQRLPKHPPGSWRIALGKNDKIRPAQTLVG